MKRRSYRCFLATSLTLTLEHTNKALTSSAGNRCSYRVPFRDWRAGLATRTRSVYRGFEHLLKPPFFQRSCQRAFGQRGTAAVPESAGPGTKGPQEARRGRSGPARPGGPAGPPLAVSPHSTPAATVACPGCRFPVREGGSPPAGRAEAPVVGPGLRSPSEAQRAGSTFVMGEHGYQLVKIVEP